MAKRALPAKYNLESVARMVSVLGAVELSGTGSLERIAAAASLSESTTLRYLSSLATHDLVERDPNTGTYRLGLSLFRLGTSAIRQRDISSVAAPVIDDLRAAFDETINLAARQANQVMIIQVVESTRPVRKGVSVGGTDAWHATALGKAVLAAIPEPQAREIVARSDLISYTPNTLSDEAALFRDLAAIATRGYAIDDEESEEGLRCVGVAVRDHWGVASYAISLSAPKSRMPYARIQEAGEYLVESSRRLSTAMGYAAGESHIENMQNWG